MLSHAGPSGEGHLLALFNHSWVEGRLSTPWKNATIHLILKAKDPNSLRPNPLQSCLTKTTETRPWATHLEGWSTT